MGKKQKEQELARQQEIIAAERARVEKEIAHEQKLASFQNKPRVVFKIMSNSSVVPVHKPAKSAIQLTPVFQYLPEESYGEEEYTEN
jgi:hypothetical protein